MKYNKEKTKERLKHVPAKHRVFIYNAAVIIDFLNQTFMPLEYFITPSELPKIDSGTDIQKKHFVRPDDYENDRITIGDLYEYYQMFRQQMDYTTPIESRYKFAVIVKKLRFSKNGWAFEPKRVGRAQIIFMIPCKLRFKCSPEDRKKFPPGQRTVIRGDMELRPRDFEEEEEKPEPKPKIQQFGFKPRNWKEAKNFVEVRFIEAKYELPEE